MEEETIVILAGGQIGRGYPACGAAFHASLAAMASIVSSAAVMRPRPHTPFEVGHHSGGRFSNAANQIQTVELREGRPSRRQRRRNRHAV